MITLILPRKPDIEMKKVIFLLLIFFPAAWGDSETLDPDHVSTPDQWTNVGGANKVASVTDDVDDNNIDEITQGEIQRFTLEDSGDIGSNDRIDSVVIYCRMTTPSGSGVVARVNHIVSSTVYGTGRTLTGTWTDYYDSYSQVPGGGDWSLDDINNLEIEVEAVTIPTLKRAKCTRMSVTVYYTPAPPAARRRLYQQLLLMGD